MQKESGCPDASEYLVPRISTVIKCAEECEKKFKEEFQRLIQYGNAYGMNCFEDGCDCMCVISSPCNVEGITDNDLYKVVEGESDIAGIYFLSTS